MGVGVLTARSTRPSWPGQCSVCKERWGSGFLRIGSEALGSKSQVVTVGQALPRGALPLTVTSGLCSLVSAMLVNQPSLPRKRCACQQKAKI